MGDWGCVDDCRVADDSQVCVCFNLGFLKIIDVFLFLPPSVVEINWHYIGDAVPAFLTLIIIPLTYKFVIFHLALAFGLELTLMPSLFSIAYGVIAGIMSYILLNGIPLIIKKLSGGRIVPSEYDLAEEWVIPPGGLTPAWVYVVFLCYLAYMSFISFIYLVRKSSNSTTDAEVSQIPQLRLKRSTRPIWTKGIVRRGAVLMRKQHQHLWLLLRIHNVSLLLQYTSHPFVSYSTP